MPPRPLLVDSLWACLCPRYLNVSTRTIRDCRHVLANASKTPGSSFRPMVTLQQCQSRYNTSLASRPGPMVSAPIVKAKIWLDKDKEINFDDMDTAALYRSLRSHSMKEPEQFSHVVKILVKDRLEKPNIEHYAGLFRANASIQEGSASMVRTLLKEVSENNIELNEWACECIFEALSVHPDPLLHVDLLRFMREKWLALSERGQHFEVASLIRSLQIELAIEKITSMEREGVEVQDWLLELLYYSVAELGDVDEAFLIAKQRDRSGYSRSLPVMWFHLLERASKALHYAAVKHVWVTQVNTSRINPSLGMCRDILVTAARHGDPELASDVFKSMHKRNTVLGRHDYKLLIEACIVADDVGFALSVLSIMSEAKIQPDQDTMSPLFVYLSQHPDRLDSVIQTMKSKRSDDETIPTAVMDCLINFSSAKLDADRTMEVYYSYRDMCPSGPQFATFRILFPQCVEWKRKDLAMFFVSEMLKQEIRPDKTIYDSLIRVCLAVEDTTDALRYYEEAKEMGFKLNGVDHDIVPKLAEQLAREGDPIAWDILDEVKGGTISQQQASEQTVRDAFRDSERKKRLRNNPNSDSFTPDRDVTGSWVQW